MCASASKGFDKPTSSWVEQGIVCTLCQQNKSHEGIGFFMDQKFYCSPCLHKSVALYKDFKRKALKEAEQKAGIA